MSKEYIVEIEMTERGEIRKSLLRIMPMGPSTPGTVRHSIKNTMSALPADSYDIPTLRRTLELKYGMRVRELIPDVTVSDAE